MSLAPLVGLLGGIGAGKSAVAAEFAKHGAKVVAADPIGHEALRDPEIKKRVIAHFGPSIVGPNQEIDRRPLGKIVFDSADQRKALEAIVFPWIGAKVREELKQARTDPSVPLVVLDAAVMLEAGWDESGMTLVYVAAPPEVRLARVHSQRNWSSADVEIREKAQMPLEEKARRADCMIDNSGDQAELARQVIELLERWGVETRKAH